LGRKNPELGSHQEVFADPDLRHFSAATGRASRPYLFRKTNKP